MDTQHFLAAIQGSDIHARFAAWRAAGEMPADTIPALAKLAGASDPGVAKAAREALTTMTHSVGKDPKAAKRSAVVKGLLDAAGDGYPMPARIHALRLLSNIAGEEHVPAIARWLSDAALREEAVYCVERIPGAASDRALLAAYAGAASEFKPRLLAALGHRRTAAAAGLCAEAMRSSDRVLAIAASKAFARIGASSPAPAFPSGLSGWDAIDMADSQVRYAERLAKSGSAGQAIAVYRSLLDRPEEHLQCAAVIGLARIGTADAAALVLPKTKSAQRNVRIAAQRAWKAMAG